MNRPLTWAIVALALVVAALAIGVYRVVINPPPDFVFLSESIDPHDVVAGQHIILTATANVFAAPECFGGAQRVFRFSDHSEARVPGTRRTIETQTLDVGSRQRVIYDTVVPTNAPSGPATLTVRETSSCGAREPVSSPAISFLIRGTVEPGIDRHYTQSRTEGGD